MKLTAKQEAFSQEYVRNGGDASAAYRKAYDASRMKPESVNVNASKLLKNAKVAPRVAELQEKARKIAEDKFEWSAEQRLKMLFEIANVCAASKSDDETGELSLNDAANAIRAIDQANKMTGDHAAIKTSNEHEITDKRNKEEIESELLALGIDPKKL